VLNRIFDHLLPIQIQHLLPDDKENLHQFVIGTCLQVNFLGNSVKEFNVRYLESVDICVDGHFGHSGMDIHNGLLENSKGLPVMASPLCMVSCRWRTGLNTKAPLSD
jgi:hypothetical protein